jgi:rhodanese-related sulfurtransferase
MLQLLVEKKIKGGIMIEPKRVSPEEVHQKLIMDKALLVCAYEDEAKFKKVHLQGAISINEFKSKLPSLSKDQEIVFYCA